METYYPEGYIVNSPENRMILSSIKGLEEASLKQKIVEATVSLCDYEHNLLVNLGEIKGIIPREEGAVGIKEGTVRDIALISRVGKAVSFIIESIDAKKKTAVLSRRAAQEKCQREYISSLIPGDIINAKITHIENFGAFCDIGCGIIALMPIDTEMASIGISAIIPQPMSQNAPKLSRCDILARTISPEQSLSMDSRIHSICAARRESIAMGFVPE